MTDWKFALILIPYPKDKDNCRLYFTLAHLSSHHLMQGSTRTNTNPYLSNLTGVLELLPQTHTPRLPFVATVTILISPHFFQAFLHLSSHATPSTLAIYLSSFNLSSAVLQDTDNVFVKADKSRPSQRSVVDEGLLGFDARKLDERDFGPRRTEACVCWNQPESKNSRLHIHCRFFSHHLVSHDSISLSFTK